jgi:hypothetical protein
MSDGRVIVAVYADGGIIHRNPSPVGGTWSWCHVDDAGTATLPRWVAHGRGVTLTTPATASPTTAG